MQVITTHRFKEWLLLSLMSATYAKLFARGDSIVNRNEKGPLCGTTHWTRQSLSGKESGWLIQNTSTFSAFCSAIVRAHVHILLGSDYKNIPAESWPQYPFSTPGGSSPHEHASALQRGSSAFAAAASSQPDISLASASSEPMICVK
jgi:hypothetical protein